MDTTRHQRDLHRGFGDALARSFEFAATLGLFTFAGYLLDRRLGTGPWLMVGLAVFCLVGQFVKLWFAYDAEMRGHEQRFAEERRR